MPANDTQHGGNHYLRGGDLQPWDVNLRFNLPYLIADAVAYLLRFQAKQSTIDDQIVDMEKARHYIEKHIETLKILQVMTPMERAHMFPYGYNNITTLELGPMKYHGAEGDRPLHDNPHTTERDVERFVRHATTRKAKKKAAKKK